MRWSSLLLALLLAVAACSPADSGNNTTTTTTATAITAEPSSTTTNVADVDFPATVVDDNGPVTIERRPEAIVSLSSTATEMLYAVGAGSQVVAVDDQSNYPTDAPITDLSGFTPNLEAILAYQPDLVIIGFDPADNPISEALEAVDVPTIFLNAASTIDNVYRQIELIGQATGHAESAAEVSTEIAEALNAVVVRVGDIGEGVTYYHELDATLFTVTSGTFIGEIYGLLGLVNIADPADADGSSGGFPQLSSEFIVAEDPDIIFLADAAYGESLQTISERPGWGAMTAVQSGAVVGLDADISSRWGPRIVDFLDVVAAAVEEHVGATTSG
jgi:iron complex transport system substrate-binding protein